MAGMSRATAEQLQNLPGFGQVKVKNIKNAFDKPFRNNATSSLAFLASQPPPSTSVDMGLAVSPTAQEINQSHMHAQEKETIPSRAESPEWDIELDLN